MVAIKEIRESKGKTQRQTAIALGVTERTICRAEAGENVGMKLITELADYFGTSTDKLLGREKTNKSDLRG